MKFKTSVIPFSCAILLLSPYLSQASSQGGVLLQYDWQLSHHYEYSYTVKQRSAEGEKTYRVDLAISVLSRNGPNATL